MKRETRAWLSSLLALALLTGAGHSDVVVGTQRITALACTAGCSQTGATFDVNGGSGGGISASAGYTGTGTQTIATGGVYAVIDFATSQWDTDSAVTTGAAWHFTVPAAKGGKYYVEAYLEPSNANVSGCILAIFVNGVEGRLLDRRDTSAGAVAPAFAGGNIVSAAAGDTIDVRLSNLSGAVAQNVNRALSWISVTYVSP